MSPKRSLSTVHCMPQHVLTELGARRLQVSDVILSCAMAPLKKAGKSVQRMVRRLNKLEGALSTESPQLAKKFGLVGGEKGGLRSRLLKTTLTAATQYEVRVGGFSGSFDMVSLACTCSRAKLTKHENELRYLKEKLKKLGEMTTTEQTWRDVTETWQATLALLKSVEVERGSAVLQCIASDEKLLKALGMAEALYRIKGDAPTELVMRLNDGAGAHIRTHAYKYDKLISLELVRIQRVKDMQWRAVTLSGSAVVATMIGTANLLSRLYYDVLESGDTRLAVLLPVLARWRGCSCCCSAAAPATSVARSCSVRGGCARRGCAGQRKRRFLPAMRLWQMRRHHRGRRPRPSRRWPSQRQRTFPPEYGPSCMVGLSRAFTQRRAERGACVMAMMMMNDGDIE